MRVLNNATMTAQRLVGTALLAGLVAATLDIIFAYSFWAWKANVPATRILQSIAAGVMGRASFQGGAATAWLGLGLHVFIAVMMAAVYAAAAARLPVLRDHPWRAGVLYGLLLYIVMTYVVVPLSAAVPQSKDLLWIASSVAAHVVLVGLPIALIVRRGWQ
jgi:uncharacterized membrane protein YagU involved in acid resistance